MGDYLQTQKYDAEFGAWMAEDAIPQLAQLCGGPRGLYPIVTLQHSSTSGLCQVSDHNQSLFF